MQCKKVYNGIKFIKPERKILRKFSNDNEQTTYFAKKLEK